MCGIVGLFTYRFNDDNLDLRVKAIIQRMLFAESLVYMESRGKDSSGIALLWDDSEMAVVKQPVEASQFAKDDGLWGEKYTNPEDKDANFKWLMKTWMRNCPEVQIKQALGHVRQGTKGSEYNPHNNHPIIVSSEKFERGGEITGDMIIGVHNGGIRNDNYLFNKHKFDRIGEVDSEVIFHLIHEYKDEFTYENLQTTFDALEGAYTVMAFNPKNVNAVAGMRETRPLNAVYIKELGTVMLISQRQFLGYAVEQYERWRIREGEAEYTYVDEAGTTQNLGKIYDVFPYLSMNWYDTTAADTMESGVFVLDLDTEVTETTKITELVKVKKIFKPAVASRPVAPSTPSLPATTPTSAATTGAGRNGGITLDDSRSMSQPAEEAEAKDILDLTDYEVEVIDPNVVEVDAVATDALTIPLEDLDETDDDGADDDDCPYDWDERIKMACDSLYSSAAQLGDKLLLSRMNDNNVQTVLDKYIIHTKSPDDAVTLLASFYDLIFPEGFAVGFKEGYDTAESDKDLLSGGEEFLEDQLRTQLDQLEATVKLKDTAIANMTASYKDIKKKKDRGEKIISIMKPLLNHLLLKEGIIDEKGELNDEKLEEVKKEAGLTGRPNLGGALMHAVINSSKGNS